MRLIFASDLHGDASRCEELLCAYKREGAARLVLLGDILYHGPRNDLPPGYDPKRTAALLNAAAEEILCVRGNCDAEVDGMVLRFPLPESAMIFCDGRDIFLTHGHKLSPEAPPPLKSGSVCVYGHFHVPAAKKVGGIHFVNVGSVSIPKENSPCCYAVLEDGVFSLKRLSGETFSEYILD